MSEETAEPVPGSAADREEDRQIKEALRQRAETHPEDPLADFPSAPAPFCGQRDPDYPNDGCCTLTPGHPRWRDDGDGDVWDHARLDAHGEMVTGWNVPAEPKLPPLPQREPGAALGCSSVSPHGDACTLARGHGVAHETHWLGERTASWIDTDPGAAERSGWHEFLGPLASAGAPFARRLLDSPGRIRILDDPQPVRVRFVDLPPRATDVPTPFGKMRGTEPGGFALVVDRFKHLAHRDREKELWERFADMISAKTLILYVGELDITGYGLE